MPNQVANASLVANSSVAAAAGVGDSYVAIVADSSVLADADAQYNVGGYGSNAYGSSPYGSAPPPFGVVSATSLSPFTVEVRFNSLLDFTFGPILDPANYSIPGLTVTFVTPESGGAVVLTTSSQNSIAYTVTVTVAKNNLGQSLDPNLHTANFSGETASPTMRAVAVSPTKVRLIFADEMLNDVNLNSTTSYVVQDMFGNSLTLVSAKPEQSVDTTTLALIVDHTVPFRTQNNYQVTISSSVRTIGGSSINPPTVTFYWVDDWVQPFDRPGLPDIRPLVIKISDFTGEVDGGILGSPDGQVFFSPALDAPTSGSVIQVEEVDVCTYAFDSYIIPQPIDPNPLYVYQPGSVPNPGNVLGPMGAVLWAPFPRNFEAQLILTPSGVYPLSPFANDRMPLANDTCCVVTLKQEWDPLFVSLLNNPAWTMFKKPGPPAVEQIVANSAMSGTAHVNRGVAAALDASAEFIDRRTSANLVANSSMFFGEAGAAAIVANSSVSANGGIPQKAHAHIVAGSFVEAEETQPFPIPQFVFRCASNLTPIPPPVGSQVIVLKEQIVANSQMAA